MTLNLPNMVFTILNTGKISEFVKSISAVVPTNTLYMLCVVCQFTEALTLTLSLVWFRLVWFGFRDMTLNLSNMVFTILNTGQSQNL